MLHGVNRKMALLHREDLIRVINIENLNLALFLPTTVIHRTFAKKATDLRRSQAIILWRTVKDQRKNLTSQFALPRNVTNPNRNLISIFAAATHWVNRSLNPNEIQIGVRFLRCVRPRVLLFLRLSFFFSFCGSGCRSYAKKCVQSRKLAPTILNMNIEFSTAHTSCATLTRTAYPSCQ